MRWPENSPPDLTDRGKAVRQDRVRKRAEGTMLFGDKF